MLNKASRTDLRGNHFGEITGKGTAESCDRQNQPQGVPKSCFVAFETALAGNVKLDPALLKEVPRKKLTIGE
jgi:hypothetical protein